MWLHIRFEFEINSFHSRSDENGIPVCTSGEDLQCPCKENFGGAFCDECKEGYYNFPECTRKFVEVWITILLQDVHTNTFSL